MKNTHFKAAFSAGLLGGILLVLIQMVFIPLVSSIDAMEFPTLIAGLVINETAADVAILLVGMVLPVLVSGLISLFIAWIPDTWYRWSMLPVGFMLGTAVFILYFILYVSVHDQVTTGLNFYQYMAFLAYGVLVSFAYHAMIKPKYDQGDELYTGYLRD